MNIALTKILLVGLFILSLHHCFAQRINIDSLKRSLASVTNEKQLTVQLFEVAIAYHSQFDSDSALHFARQALQLATKINYKKYRCKTQILMGEAFYDKQNYPQSISYYLNAYAIAEQMNSDEDMSTVARVLSYSYYDSRDLNKAINYLHIAAAIARKNNDQYWVSRNLCQIGFLFTELNQTDSAQAYYDQSYKIALRDNNDRIPYILTGFGIINDKNGNELAAHRFYKSALDSCFSNDDLLLGYQVSSRIASLFKKENNIDSSMIYYEFAQLLFDTLRATSLDWPRREVDFYKELANFYSDIDSNKRAVNYFKRSQVITDSLFNESNNRVIQDYTINAENERERLAYERHHNIQRLVIGVSLLAFIILFFLLTRSLLVHVNLIRFIGVLMLLLVFEFFNLLLHPWLEELTHGSQTTMLLALALVGSILIPLHHKLEKWVVKKVVQKNTEVRLAAAQKKNSIEEKAKGIVNK